MELPGSVHRSGGSEIARLTLEHLWLTLSAMLLAILIGLPLGVFSYPPPRALARPVIACANVIQTIPSLALFGLLLPVPWLGENAARLAILALTGYALLPILRNTYAGIESVDPALIDVSNALGMSKMQRLFEVELPLSASVILAGIRTATVTCVGVATIAAAIGAGGLGEFIFRGVASVDNGLVLAGAIPAALLALAADAILGLAEKRLTVRRSMIILETERLIFAAPIEPADFEPFCAMEADLEVRRYVGGASSPHSRSRRAALLEPGPCYLPSRQTLHVGDSSEIGRSLHRPLRHLLPHRSTNGPVPGEAALGFYLARPLLRPRPAPRGRHRLRRLRLRRTQPYADRYRRPNWQPSLRPHPAQDRLHHPRHEPDAFARFDHFERF